MSVNLRDYAQAHPRFKMGCLICKSISPALGREITAAHKTGLADCKQIVNWLRDEKKVDLYKLRKDPAKVLRRHLQTCGNSSRA